jgi:hypothetical protein
MRQNGWLAIYGKIQRFSLLSSKNKTDRHDIFFPEA